MESVHWYHHHITNLSAVIPSKEKDTSLIDGAMDESSCTLL
jgi:hypothetical protein